MASYTSLLLTYADRLDTPMAFDTSAGVGTGVSLANYAANSVGWFEGARKDASTAAGNKEALAARTAEALPNACLLYTS